MDTANNSKRFQALKNVLYPCNATSCGQLFTRRSDLRKHRLIHRDKHPFECSESNCGKTFKRKDHLVRHQQIHSDGKPFYCDWDGCGEEFRKQSQLVEHQRNHSGENSFLRDWEGCGKTFTRNRNLNRHRRDIPQKISWQTASTFDSDAFDDMIRKQCGALPTSDRPGRKTWFRKVAKRLVWLRHEQARAGTQPQLFGRNASFAFVEEKDLPLYVKANPAWVDACAWSRKEEELNRELQDMQRRVIRDVQRRQQAKRARAS